VSDKNYSAVALSRKPPFSNLTMFNIGSGSSVFCSEGKVVIQAMSFNGKLDSLNEKYGAHKELCIGAYCQYGIKQYLFTKAKGKVVYFSGSKVTYVSPKFMNDLNESAKNLITSNKEKEDSHDSKESQKLR
jgi:hypothetical protein